MAQPARPARRRLRAEDRHDQIVAAATSLIAERGFRGVSIQDVAERCALTAPGVLHHVGTKDALLVAVLEHRDAADNRSLAAALGVTETAIETGAYTVALPQLCHVLVRRNASQPEIVRLYSVLHAESLDPAHPAHGYFDARERAALLQLTRLAQGAPDPAALAREVLAAMDGLQLQWLRHPAEVDLVAQWDALAPRLFAELPSGASAGTPGSPTSADDGSTDPPT